MKNLLQNKKLIIGLVLGLLLIIGLAIFLLRKKSADKRDTSSPATASNTTNSEQKAVADAGNSGGIISAVVAAGKGVVFS